MKKTDRLGEDKITKLLMEFSVPATVGMLVTAFYNIIDRIFIGNSPDLGSMGLAAVSISFPLTLFLMALASLFGVGGVTMFSIKLGENKPEEAEKYLGNSITLLIISSVIFMIISLIFLKPLLLFFGASPQVLPYSIEYLRIVLLGSVFLSLSISLNKFIRADGSPKIAMISMFLGAGFNIVFNPIFIYVLGLGMTGAALATVGGQFLTTIWVLGYFTSKRCTYRLKLKTLKLTLDYIKKITITGIPTFFSQFANSILVVILNKSLVIYGGDIAVSAMSIIISIQTFIILPIFGITQGIQPIIGYNFGGKKIARVKECVKLAIITASVIVILAWLITRIFPTSLIRMFSNEPELISFGSNALSIWFICLPAIGFQVVAASYFQAVGKAKIATVLSSVRQLIILIPAIIILSNLYGLYGILYAAPISDFLSAIITSILLWTETKHLNLQLSRELI